MHGREGPEGSGAGGQGGRGAGGANLAGTNRLVVPQCCVFLAWPRPGGRSLPCSLGHLTDCT